MKELRAKEREEMVEKNGEEAIPKREALDFMGAGFGFCGGLWGAELEEYSEQTNPLFSGE